MDEDQPERGEGAGFTEAGKKMRIGINGFGRIGRGLFRRLSGHPTCHVVAINDDAPVEELVHYLRFDSFVGRWESDIQITKGGFATGGRLVTVHRDTDWSKLRWDASEVDLVVESTRVWKNRSEISAHFRPGVQRVVVTANCPFADTVIIPGITDVCPLPTQRIISSSSCTTQCLAAVLQPLIRKGIISALDFTVIHQVSADQKTVDVVGHGLRIGRSALTSAIPIATTAGAGIEHLFPQLAGRVTGLVVRVPTTAVSLVFLTLAPGDSSECFQLEEVHDTLRRAQSSMLRVTDVPLVSVDYAGETAAAIVDTTLSRRPSENLLTLGAWFDNEAGYITRLVHLLEELATLSGHIL